MSKATVIFKIGEVEVKTEAGVPMLSNMPQDGKDNMTVNNALSILKKEFGFDFQNKYPNIKETAKVIY